MSRAAYEIRAVGEVPRSMLEDFEGVTVSVDPAGSTIHAELVDDAALHGLLAALRRGGFELVDVRREQDLGIEVDSPVSQLPPEDPPATG